MRVKLRMITDRPSDRDDAFTTSDAGMDTDRHPTPARDRRRSRGQQQQSSQRAASPFAVTGRFHWLCILISPPSLRTRNTLMEALPEFSV